MKQSNRRYLESEYRKALADAGECDSLAFRKWKETSEKYIAESKENCCEENYQENS